MTNPFRSRSLRAIARSRGHMKAAELDFQKNQHSKAHFSVAKANHALDVGLLHESARVAEAQEVRAAIEVLDYDPDLLTEIEYKQLQDKVLAWVAAVTTGSDENDEDG